MWKCMSMHNIVSYICNNFYNKADLNIYVPTCLGTAYIPHYRYQSRNQFLGRYTLVRQNISIYLCMYLYILQHQGFIITNSKGTNLSAADMNPAAGFLVIK